MSDKNSLVTYNQKPTFKNAPTLYKVFSTFYKDKFGADYKSPTFIGRETKALKEAIETHGFDRLLGAMYSGVKQGHKDVHVMYILGGINSYLPTCQRPDLYASVLIHGTPKVRQLWRTVIHLETKWFPTASDKKKLAKTIGMLEKWNEEYGQSERDTVHRSDKSSSPKRG